MSYFWKSRLISSPYVLPMLCNALSASLLHGFGRFMLSNERPAPVRCCNASEGYDGHSGKQQTNVSTYVLDIFVLMVRKPLMPVHGMRGSLRVFHHLRPTSLSRHFGFRRLNCPNPWRRFADTTTRASVVISNPAILAAFCKAL